MNLEVSCGAVDNPHLHRTPAPVISRAAGLSGRQGRNDWSVKVSDLFRAAQYPQYSVNSTTCQIWRKTDFKNLRPLTSWDWHAGGGVQQGSRDNLAPLWLLGYRLEEPWCTCWWAIFFQSWHVSKGTRPNPLVKQLPRKWIKTQGETAQHLNLDDFSRCKTQDKEMADNWEGGTPWKDRFAQGFWAPAIGMGPLSWPVTL